jgi:chromosome segregation ATPase
VDNVKNWKGELEVKRSELEKEIDATETYLVRIEKRLQSLQENLHIAQTTLANRYDEIFRISKTKNEFSSLEKNVMILI